MRSVTFGTDGTGIVVEMFTYRPAERVALSSLRPKGPPPAATENRTSALKTAKQPQAAPAAEVTEELDFTVDSQSDLGWHVTVADVGWHFTAADVGRHFAAVDGKCAVVQKQ